MDSFSLQQRRRRVREPDRTMMEAVEEEEEEEEEEGDCSRFFCYLKLTSLMSFDKKNYLRLVWVFTVKRHRHKCAQYESGTEVALS